jgi:EAL domain-containing protein (putative c-di-GMP-specific phosphodiesterase class I)
LAKLRAIGIDFAQGYGIDRPQPLEIAPQTAFGEMKQSV